MYVIYSEYFILETTVKMVFINMLTKITENKVPQINCTNSLLGLFAHDLQRGKKKENKFEMYFGSDSLCSATDIC